MRRIWNLKAEWAAQPTLRPQEWQPNDSAAQWWSNTAKKSSVPRKAMASIAMLVTWELWKERNHRVFRHYETPAPTLMSLIKQEALAWVAAGAKDLPGLILQD